MKKWEIIYNEHKLNDYCNITNVSKSILPQRTNKSKEIPSANGSYYLGYKYGERIIKVDIYIDSKDKDDYTQKVRDLSYILNVEEPKKMKINDDEGKYVFAVLNGGTDLEKIITTGKTTLEFVCYDPTIYSDKWSCFTPNERGIITLQNDSNYKTYQNIGVAFKNKACFFQATNKRGKLY